MWTFKQAAKLAPEDMPTSRPSSSANLLAFTIASSVVTLTASSMTEVSKISGMNPGPIPWILCLPASPPERWQHVRQLGKILSLSLSVTYYFFIIYWYHIIWSKCVAIQLSGPHVSIMKIWRSTIYWHSINCYLANEYNPLLITKETFI
jgi:hypothetical protein